MRADQQLEFFRTRFGRIPTPLQRDLFRADLARLNLDVMDAALRQTERKAHETKRPPDNARLAVLGQYARIVASIGQLFPVFFAFESAWRSYTAARLTLIYGADHWWHGVRDAVSNNRSPLSVTNFNGHLAKPEVANVVSRILAATPNPDRLSTTYDLIEEASMGQVEKLIERHWLDMSFPFSSTVALGNPTSSVFLARFGKVRRARNQAYHHRVVEDRAGVVAAAEQILDLLDVHLGDRVETIASIQQPPLAFKVFKEERHS